MSSKFSFNTVTDFDKHIETSIPQYSDIVSAVLKLSKYFLRDNTNVYDVGCSTGKLLKGLETDKKIQKIGIDNSNHLLPNSEEISFLNVDLNKTFAFTNASFIVSLFTVQFLEKSNRQMVLNSIYNGLEKGGAFVFVEKVYSADSMIQDIFTFLYYDFKKDTFSEKEILTKEVDLRNLLQPLSHDENIEMLKEAGFKKVDMFYKYYNFEGILCIK